MQKLFLFDAYALIYRSYYAFIKNPRINSKGLNTSAVMGFVNTLQEIITKEQPTHVGVAFDHGKTFRNEAFPEYKAQREETPEDIKKSVPIIKQLLEAWHIPCLQVDGFEADDVIGTLAMKSGILGIETYMLTPDKDYGQLVRENVYQFRPRHGGGYEKMGPKEVCEKYGIALDALEKKALKLLHAKTGAALARDVFGVDDEIYNAILWHTTGKPDMTVLEKVIYLADFIEPTRDFPGVDALRRTVWEDLDRGLLMGLEMTVEEMEEMGNPIHINTLAARDYLKGKTNEGKAGSGQQL